MNKPKTITTFLLDGEPTGTKVVELSNWSGKAYFIPRNKLKKTFSDKKTKEDLDSQCVYFLIGDTEEGDRKVYVGEAENSTKRINQHNRQKDFWNLAVCFLSKDENLTKAHVKYLEAKLAKKIKQAGRAELENSTTPTESGLPRRSEAEMKEFMNNIELILSSLGSTFLQDLKEEASEDVFYCKSNRSEAKGELTNEGFVVFEGSKISKEETDSINKGLHQLRQKALESGELKEGDEYYILTKDKVISSPSYAAGFVLGRNANGWTEWRNEKGESLDEIKRD